MIELNTVYNEDCLLGMNRIPDKSVDMILCDLPYGTTACKWDVIIPFVPLWGQYERVIKDNGAIVLFGAEPFSSLLRLSNKNYKYDWIWEKERPSNFASAKYQPLRYTENISVFYKKSPVYIPQMTVGRKNNSVGKGVRRKINESNLPTSKVSYQNNPESNLKFPKNIIRFERGVSQIHPTQKPVDLFEYLIKTYTNEGETVLDNCMGSGTTAIACINTNRNYIGFEKEEKYYNIIQERIKNHTQQKQLFAA
jgi:site-specific DNA-methyltransferase (adenine-specific)